MTALVCPSCRRKLKAPEQLAGKTAACPKCRTAIAVPAAKAAGLALGGTRPHRLSLPPADAETLESAALQATAELPVLNEPLPAADAEPEPDRGTGRGLLLPAVGAVALAAAAAFALWMAAGAVN